MNKKMKVLVETFTDAQSELDLLSFTDRFFYGYQLSVLMPMEVYNGKDDVTIHKEDC